MKLREFHLKLIRSSTDNYFVLLIVNNKFVLIRLKHTIYVPNICKVFIIL